MLTQPPICVMVSAMKPRMHDVTDLTHSHDLLILCARIGFNP